MIRVKINKRAVHAQRAISTVFVMERNGSPLNKKQIAILRALQYLNKEQREAVLRKADSRVIRCICECALNVLRGNVPLETGEKRKLRRHASVLRRLAAKKGCWKSKKRFVVQSGGFLPLLLAPILGTLLSNLIGGRG